MTDLDHYNKKVVRTITITTRTKTKKINKRRNSVF